MNKRQQAEVKKVMDEFNAGNLHSGKGGKKVTKRKQAIAIALSQAGVNENTVSHLITDILTEMIEEKKHKLDPVGKEDHDVNNDGKTDKTDDYLHNRRKAIAHAMGKHYSKKKKRVVKEEAEPPNLSGLSRFAEIAYHARELASNPSYTGHIGTDMEEEVVRTAKSLKTTPEDPNQRGRAFGQGG
jgi:hypothetical protein